MKFAKANVSLSSVNQLFGVIVAVIFILGNICNNQLIFAVRKERQIIPCSELYGKAPPARVFYACSRENRHLCILSCTFGLKNV